MKRFRLFTFLLLLGMAPALRGQSGRATIPKTLQPRLFLNGRDTTFCFSQAQVREIAKRMTAGEYDQQTIAVQSQQIVLLSTDIVNQKSLVLLREEENRLLTEKVEVRDTVIFQQDKVILGQRNDLKKQASALKRQRTLTKITGILGIAGIVLVFLL
jgi:hypothetical protein